MRWRSSDRDSAAMVLARLSVVAPDLASLVVASPRRSPRVLEVAHGLANAARERGRQVRLLDTGSRGSGQEMSAADFGTLEAVRDTLHSPAALTIVTGGGILDDPDIFMAAAVADGVLLVAEGGKSMRDDLRRCRAEIDRAGGRIVGAVLVR